MRETALNPDKFVMPFFVRPGKGEKRPIASMPGQFQFSPDELLKAAQEVQTAGIQAVLLFGIPETKDSRGSGAYAPDGIIQQAARLLRSRAPGLLVIADLCFCEYTDHGHCGIVRPDGAVDNSCAPGAIGLHCRCA